MKILIAPDSFKNSLTAVEVAKSIKKGLTKHIGKKFIDTLPLSDGGDGFLEALYQNVNSVKKRTKITDSQGNSRYVPYLLMDDYQTVVIESAKLVGSQVFDENSNILSRNSYLLGVLIKKLIKKKFRNFIIGLGGSYTNDLGIGMLSALGMKFYDEEDNLLEPIPLNLHKIDYIDMTKMEGPLYRYNFTVLCDVDNPLTGKNGAAKTYAKQKGATNKEISLLEAGANRLLDLLTIMYGWDIDRNLEKLGSAGGLAFAFKYFLYADITSGFDYFSKLIKLEDKIKKYSLVITGEGNYDNQSAYGKVTGKVAKMCKTYQIPFLIMTGGAPQIIKTDNHIIDISSQSFTKDYSIKNCKNLLIKYAELISMLLTLNKEGKK